MLVKFSVSNFKSFRENFEIDFTKVYNYDFNTECIKNNCINNAIVYGRNGVGKSNLGFAIFDIIEQSYSIKIKANEIIITIPMLIVRILMLNFIMNLSSTSKK